MPRCAGSAAALTGGSHWGDPIRLHDGERDGDVGGLPGHAETVIERMVHHGQQGIAVRDLGGSGPDVLLLHGLGCNLAFWDLVAPSLSSQFRLVSVDLPGHGRSTVPAPSFEDDLAAVDAVRTALELRSPAVVGHSYGGMLAIGLGAVHPNTYRHAVNIDGVGFHHRRTPPELWSAIAGDDEQEWPDVGDRAWMEAEVLADKQELAAVGVASEDLSGEIIRRGFVEAADNRWHRKPPAAHFLALGKSLRELDLLNWYARSTCPTLTVICARRQAPTPEIAAAMARHVDGIRAELETVPSARVVDMPGGHYLHLEVPAALAALLADTCR